MDTDFADSFSSTAIFLLSPAHLVINFKDLNMSVLSYRISILLPHEDGNESQINFSYKVRLCWLNFYKIHVIWPKSRWFSLAKIEYLTHANQNTWWPIWLLLTNYVCVGASWGCDSFNCTSCLPTGTWHSVRATRQPYINFCKSP